MRSTSQLCRHCVFYDLAAVLNKAGRMKPNSAARCMFPAASIVYPASIPANVRPEHCQYMDPKDGADCPTFVAASVPFPAGTGHRARCIGPWPSCKHGEGTCTASPDYQAAICASNSATQLNAKT